MKNILAAIFISSSLVSFCQINAKSLDFWIGKWKVSWSEGKDSVGMGTNHIYYKIDSTVIQEDFKILEGKSKGFQGTSISTYNKANNIWNQAWGDNQGGYFSFHSELSEKSELIFSTEIIKNGNNTIISRMRFTQVKPNSFTWIWEKSTDSGKTWTTNWQIFYERTDE